MGAVQPGRDGHDHRRLPAGGRPFVWRGLAERRLNRQDTEKEASRTSGSPFRSAKRKQRGLRTEESRAAAAASSGSEARRRHVAVNRAAAHSSQSLSECVPVCVNGHPRPPGLVAAT